MLECLVLQAEGLYNSALFASDGQVLVGRVFKEGKGYQALLVDKEKGIALILGGKGDEGLYSVKECGHVYVAVGHSGDRALFLFYEKASGRVRPFVGPKGILWQTDCNYAVGGAKEKLWHLFLVDLKNKKGRALSVGEHIYAYSLAESDRGYVLVGRIGQEGNYDSFILWMDYKMKPFRALRSAWRENDYLRYTNGSWAVGRLEIEGDSEGFIVGVEGLESLLYRRQGFDYFRYINLEVTLIAGEGEDRSGVRKSLLVHREHGFLLGEDFSAVRFYDEKDNTAYGYVYVGGKAYAFRVRNPQLRSEFKYQIEEKPLRWKSFKLRVEKDFMEFRSINFPITKASYLWEDCKRLY